MRKTRCGGIAAGAALVAVGIALIVAAPAGASVTNGCGATLNGTDLTNLPESSQITVGKNDIVPMTMTAPSGKDFTQLRISLSFGLFQWDVYNESAGGGTWSKNIDVNSFAKYGVGLYSVHGSGQFSDGSGDCRGTAMVKVEGNPLSTVAGITAAAATGVGVLSVLGAGLAAGGGGGSGAGGSFTPQDAANEERAKERERETTGEMIEAANEASAGWCFLFTLLLLPLLLVLLGTSALMLAVVAPVRVKVRRKTWPMIIGPLGGLLTGFGVGVLLQQYAIIFPTRTWSIVYLAGGFAFGLAVPLLRRMLSR